MFSKNLAVLTLCVGIAACGKPYRTPDVRGVKSFVGATDMAQDSRRVRLIMSHGMCSSNQLAVGGVGENWVADRSEVIAKIVGDATYQRNAPDVPYTSAAEYYGTSDSPAVARYDIDLTGPDGIVYELRMLKWGQSLLSAVHAMDDLETQVQQPPLKRAKLNHSLKTGLMDDCLVDAVAYSGSRGNSLRAAYREAICDLMGGVIQGTNTGTSAEVVNCKTNTVFEDTPTILIPESLGAKIMMDAVLAIRGEQKSNTLGAVQAMHLVTNQIPLLSQADAITGSDIKNTFGPTQRTDGAGGFQRMIQQLSSDTKRASIARQTPMAIVAHNDPNDLVGYPLSESWIPDDGSATLTNIIYSNAGVFINVFANPLTAHSLTLNPDVYRVIIEGMP